MPNAEGSLGKMEYSDRELLVRILTQAEAIYERLNRGDSVMSDHDKRLDTHDKEIGALQHRIRDLDGGDGWPSWVEIQKAHLRQRTLFSAAMALWTAVLAAGAGVAGWFGFLHHKP
jgi:hypothetical protein